MGGKVSFILFYYYNDRTKGHILLWSEITMKMLETFTVFSSFKVVIIFLDWILHDRLCL